MACDNKARDSCLVKQTNAANGSSTKQDSISKMSNSTNGELYHMARLETNGRSSIDHGVVVDIGSSASTPAATAGATSKDGPDKFWIRMRKFLKGISLTILSAFFFSLTTLVVKHLTEVSAGTVAGFRYLGIVILAFPLVWESSQPMFGLPGTYIWIAIRGLAGGTSVFCRYSALHYMSMADSTIIILSMPVFVFVFARIFLKEPFGRYHVLAFFMSVIGILFASKVDIAFWNKSSPSPSYDNATSTTVFSDLIYSNATTMMPMNVTTLEPPHTGKLSNQIIGTLYSLGATFVGCFVYIIIRKLKEVDKYVILFNFSIISMVEMVVIDYFVTGIHLPMSGYSPYLMVLVGILSFYAQLLLTRAIQIEEAGVVSVVRTSSEAFFAFVLQIIFFQQIPDWLTITGAILVLSAVFLLSFRKYIIGLPENDSFRQRFRWLAK